MYLLRCVDGSLYCGWTNHLDQRLAAHAEGRGGRYTRSKRPVRLVLEFVCESPTQARRLEALGTSAPGDQVFDHFGINAESILKAAKALLEQ